MPSLSSSPLILLIFEFFNAWLWTSKGGAASAEQLRDTIRVLQNQGWIFSLTPHFLSKPVVPLIDSSSPRLRIPDLLKNWPWPAQCNIAFTNKLREEEQAFFLALPEVKDSQQLQKVVHKSFVREYSNFMMLFA